MNPLFALVRHGRTAGNEKNIYRGWSNKEFAQLDECGQQDAKDAAIYLKGLGMEFPIILVDDLERTQETAKIIADILGIKEIITDKRLRPVNVGDYTGKSKSLYPLDGYMETPNKKVPGGESINEFNARESKVFADICEALAEVRKQTGKQISFLIIGHGSTSSFLYHQVNKGGKEVGYEGMTEPGGIMLFTKDGLSPIFKKKEKNGNTVAYPPDHKPGMKVPKGGSSCAKCEYLMDDKISCRNEYFIRWNGSKTIPAPIDSYCSDWFDTGEKS
jgi:broad specificity phosphatase PhoE